MLHVLTKRFRVRAAIAVIAAYALCVMAPHVALALSDGAMAVHCLNVPEETPAVHDHGAQDHGAMSHHHADGAVHHHQDDGSAPQKNDGGKTGSRDCCGVFCMSMLASDNGVELATNVVHSADFAAPVASRAGDDPDLPYRPPNV